MRRVVRKDYATARNAQDFTHRRLGSAAARLPMQHRCDFAHQMRAALDYYRVTNNRRPNPVEEEA